MESTRQLRRVRTGDVKTNDRVAVKDEVDDDDVAELELSSDFENEVADDEEGRFLDSGITIDVTKMLKFMDERDEDYLVSL